MWRGMLNVAVATALYFLAHSVLANDGTKAAVARLVGPRAADAGYRPAYLLQGVVFLGLLGAYVRRQPGRDLYQARGRGWWALRAGQGVALGVLLWAAVSVGVSHLSGWEGVAAWWRGAEVPPMPDGQEPSPAGDGTMRTAGPLGYTRHPLNWSLLPLFWL